MNTKKLHQFQMLVESDCDIKTVARMLTNIREEEGIDGVVMLSAQELRSADLVGVDVMTHSLSEVIATLNKATDIINSNSGSLNTMQDLFTRQVTILEDLTKTAKTLTNEVSRLKGSS